MSVRVSFEEKEMRVFARLKTRSHSHSFSVPLTELFSEPFLKDLNLIWQMDISLFSFHGDSIYGEIPNCQILE